MQTVADTAAVVSTTAPTDADDGNIVYYRRRNDRMEIALSFDDGTPPDAHAGDPVHPAEYGVPATFFMVGENVLYYPEAAEAVLAAGARDRQPQLRSPAADKAERSRRAQSVSRCEEALASLGEYRPHLCARRRGEP